MKRHRNDGLRKICACPRRQWAKCAHPWHFSFKWKGRHYRFSLDRHLGQHVASKTDAKSAADQLRAAIRDGVFDGGAPVSDRLTLGELLDLYVQRDVQVRRPETAAADQGQINLIKAVSVPLPTTGTRRLGDWPLSDITTDTIERYREVRAGAGGGVVAINRNLALLRACFNWAIRVGYLERTPFKRGTEAAVKLARELPRSRRLEGDEEPKLLAACGPHLRALVEAALETGMRRGELLSLQWRQVRFTGRGEIFLPAQKTKAKRDRRIPMSSRLRAILEMRQTGPDGEAFQPDAYVFGNEIGQRIGSSRRAWQVAVLKAHGHTLEWTKTNQLVPALQATYKAIDLHFHDLRREAGSRWLEGGVPLHVVRDWLGHSNIAQTSTYLAGTASGAFDYMQRFEARREAAASDGDATAAQPDADAASGEAAR